MAFLGNIANAIVGNNGQQTTNANNAAAAQAGQAQANTNVNNALNTQQSQAAMQAAQLQQQFAQGAAASGTQQAQTGGYGNQQAAYNALGQLANAPTPQVAQTLLANQTGQNVNTQAALMAGQRGVGSNAGLLARQAAQQGATTQQQAVGQGAALAAQQQVAQQQLQAGLIGQQANIGAQQVAQQQAAQNQEQNALNSAASSYLGNQNIAAGLYGQANQIGGNLNNTVISGTTAQAVQGQQQQQALTQGLIGGPGSVVGSIAGKILAKGGMVQKYDAGGLVQEDGPASMLGKQLHSMKMAKGGKVPALVSPGEKIIPKKDVKQVAQGQKSPMEAGKTVPGKPKVGGAKNSYANDTVPAKLEAGSIVLPRSVTQAKNAPKEAHKFVTKILAEQGLRGKKK